MNSKWLLLAAENRKWTKLLLVAAFVLLMTAVDPALAEDGAVMGGDEWCDDSN